MSQTSRLLTLLSDGLPHRTDEIVEKVYGHGLSLSRVGARVYDLKTKYELNINGWHDPKNKSLYWYQLKAEAYRREALTDSVRLCKPNGEKPYSASDLFPSRQWTDY
jgi:hypothetical protein